MELIINTRGAKLSKVDDRFQVTYEGNKQEFSVKTIEKILITTSALVTTDSLKLAVENNIAVVFLEYNGEPYGRVWHSKLGSIATIRRKQLKLIENRIGVELVKSWVTQKLQNQINHLSKLKLNRAEEKVLIINETINEIIKHKDEIERLENEEIGEIRGLIEGHEGYSAKKYFNTLGASSLITSSININAPSCILLFIPFFKLSELTFANNNILLPLLASISISFLYSLYLCPNIISGAPNTQAP